MAKEKCEYLPAGHAAQAPFPASGWNSPDGHVAQPTALPRAANRPRAHTRGHAPVLLVLLVPVLALAAAPRQPAGPERPAAQAPVHRGVEQHAAPRPKRPAGHAPEHAGVAAWASPQRPAGQGAQPVRRGARL